MQEKGKERLTVTAWDREARRKFDLLWLLTEKEVILRYKRTSIGIFWSLLHPLILSCIYYLAFKVFLRIQMENYLFFLLCALFPWNWFSTSVTLSATTLIANGDLIKKVRFPRSLLVISVILSQLVNYLFCLPIIIAVSYFQGTGMGLNWIIGIPVLLIIQFIATAGISIGVSMINAYFRDMEYLIGVALNMLYWLTPVIYPISAIPDEYKNYLLFNPLSYLITGWRDLFMSNTIDWYNIGISFISSLFFLFLGIIIFDKFGKNLDEAI